MRGFHALEAEVIAALAYYVGLLHRGVYDGIVAVGCGAVLRPLIVCYKRFCVVLLVFLIVGGRQQVAEVLIRHDQFARVDRAPTENYLWAVLQLGFEVALVARTAKGMATLHAQVVRGIVIADGAAEVLTRSSQVTESLISLV